MEAKINILIEVEAEAEVEIRREMGRVGIERAGIGVGAEIEIGRGIGEVGVKREDMIKKIGRGTETGAGVKTKMLRTATARRTKTLNMKIKARSITPMIMKRSQRQRRQIIFQRMRWKTKKQMKPWRMVKQVNEVLISVSRGCVVGIAYIQRT